MEVACDQRGVHRLGAVAVARNVQSRAAGQVVGARTADQKVIRVPAREPVVTAESHERDAEGGPAGIDNIGLPRSPEGFPLTDELVAVAVRSRGKVDGDAVRAGDIRKRVVTATTVVQLVLIAPALDPVVT